MQWSRLLAAACVMSLSACAGLGTTPGASLDYQPELFSSADTHTSRFEHPPGVTCEAARRALLSQGYIISEAKSDQVRARKLFQPEVDRHVELDFRVVCAGQGADKRVTEAFANGVQDQYGMRKVKSSASLGVGGVGSVSLPVQGDNDTLVKIGSHTITDSKMYRRFFELMQQHLDPHASLDAPAQAVTTPQTRIAPRESLVPPSPPAQPVVVVVPMSSVLAGGHVAHPPNTIPASTLLSTPAIKSPESNAGAPTVVAPTVGVQGGVTPAPVSGQALTTPLSDQVSAPAAGSVVENPSK